MRNIAAGVSIARTSSKGPIGDLEDLDHASLRISARLAREHLFELGDQRGAGE